MADNQLRLFDHTWIDNRAKEGRIHSVDGRPIPGWLGGSIHLPSLGVAAAGAAAAAVVRWAVGVVAGTLNPLTSLLLWAAFIAVGAVSGYIVGTHLDILEWLSVQRDWIRQPRRIRSEWAGAPDPDQVHTTTILWRPVDAGWLARQQQVHHLTQQRIPR